MYYKFISLAKIDRVIDVFLNNRLFALNYNSLYNPMEGFYLSDKNFNKQVRNNGGVQIVEFNINEL